MNLCVNSVKIVSDIRISENICKSKCFYVINVIYISMITPKVMA